MRIRSVITACAATALLAAPTGAVAGVTADKTPGPKASTATKAKAYGKRCKGQRRSGGSRSDYRKCLTAMAKVANGKASPRRACKVLSKTKVGKKSPYSRCLSAGKKLQAQVNGQYTDPLG